MAHRTPMELIDLYWERVWNARETDVIREICADPIVRHDPMSVTVLSHEEQIARVAHQSERTQPLFTHEVLLANDTYVCSVWNMLTRRGAASRICGIEVFKAVEGRLTDCWNSSYSRTYWGRGEGDDDPGHPSPSRAPWVGQDRGRLVHRSPEELIRVYRDRVWNQGDAELLREIVADPLACHKPGDFRYVALSAQMALLEAQHAEAMPEFTHEVVIANDSHVCSIWNMRARKGPELNVSGIEVFRVEGGRLVEHWAAPETRGKWGRRGDPAVPKDLPKPHLLDDVGKIDNLWMQSVFSHAGLDVPRIAMVDCRPLGHGNLSSTVTATIAYNQTTNDVPTSVVCKFNSILPEAQAHLVEPSPYRTEVSTYRYLGENPPIRVPRVYYAAVSDDGLTVNLVLEDLGTFCEAGDQIAGCGQAEAAAVTRELARMHAHFWGREELKTLSWMSTNRPPNSRMAELYSSGAARFRERYADDLSTEEMAVIEAFIPRVSEWSRIRPETSTLLHVDPRVDNIMFDRRSPGQVHAYIIDWQVAGHGDPQYDLAYFLTGSLSVEDRRACEHALIAEHAAVISTVDPTYTVERAIDAFRRYIFSGLYMTVAASNVMPDTPHNRSLLTTLARRNCAAVRDWRGFSMFQRSG